MKMIYVGAENDAWCELAEERNQITRGKVYEVCSTNFNTYRLQDNNNKRITLSSYLFKPVITKQEKIKELENDISMFNEKIKDAQKELDSLKVWAPSGGLLRLYGDGSIEEFVTGNKKYVENGCAFETRKEAEEAQKYYRFIHRLFKLAKELNGDWKPNWKDANTGKWQIDYDLRNNTFHTSAVYTTITMLPPFKDKETAEQAIEILKNETKYWE